MLPNLQGPLPDWITNFLKVLYPDRSIIELVMVKPDTAIKCATSLLERYFMLRKREDKHHISLEEWGISLNYPDRDNPVCVEVELCDVRATDGFRFHYDFERDGWAIEQAKRGRWLDGEPADEQWTETAFLQSWAINEDPTEEDCGGTTSDPS